MFRTYICFGLPQYQTYVNKIGELGSWCRY